jgi:hypothetical protein
MTIWTQAVSNLLAALNATGSPAVTWRARFEAVGVAESALNLFPTRISITYACANDSASTEAKIIVRAYTAATSEVDVAVDPLVLWAWQCIRRDPTLGEIVSDARVEEVEMGYLDKSASDQVCVDITVCVNVEVGRDDPSINKTYPS